MGVGIKYVMNLIRNTRCLVQTLILFSKCAYKTEGAVHVLMLICYNAMVL